jgi:hypothetical protein
VARNKSATDSAAIREVIAMAFFKREFGPIFKRELGPIERFENALKDKVTARQKLAERLSAAESELAEKRTAAERLAVAGAANARLERAEVSMRAVEDRTKTLRAELQEFDEQVASAERALADAKAQRDRDATADQIEAMAAAIERAAPGFDNGATAMVEAVTKAAMSIPEATRFSSNVDAVRREVLAAADLICWELRSAAVRTRAGNANLANISLSESEQPASAEIERQLIYTLHPLQWREGDEVRKVAAFALVGLPKALLPIALQHQHVDHLNARRVQTLMHIHGSAGINGEPEQDDPQLVDLDALLAEETPSPQADVA